MNPFKVSGHSLAMNAEEIAKTLIPAPDNNRAPLAQSDKRAPTPASSYKQAQTSSLQEDIMDVPTLASSDKQAQTSSLQEDKKDVQTPASSYKQANTSSLQEDKIDVNQILTGHEQKLSLDNLILSDGYAQQSRGITEDIEQSLLWKDKIDLSKIITCDMLRGEKVVAAYMKFTEECDGILQKMKRVKEFKALDTKKELVSLEVDVDKYKFINIKSYKHCVENFLHVLSQNDISMWTTGPLYQSEYNSEFFIGTQIGFYEIKIKSRSQNNRLLWGQTMLALLLAELVETFKNTPIKYQMDAPKQPIEDTLTETEVTKVAENTIITQEQDDSTNVHIEQDTDLLQSISTTEQLSKLTPIAERFVRIFDSTQVFNTTDTFNSLIFSLDVPNGLYAHLDSTIVSALRSFTLIKTDVELLIKINSNQAQCGRYILSHFPRYDMLASSTLYDAEYNNVLKALQRDHAVVDISKSNDVFYEVKYENTIPWLPIQTDEVGTVTGGSFAKLHMRTLSPLRIADMGNPMCPFQVFARLKNTVLTGMRYPQPLDTPGTTVGRNSTPIHYQMDSALKSTVSSVQSIPIFGQLFGIAGKVLGHGSLALGKLFGANKERIDNVEKRLKYIGIINKDRPVDISHPTPLLPVPVHSYAHGRGPYFSKKMRVQPEATTPHMPDHTTVNDTPNINDLVQIPGYVTSFNVTTTNTQGDLLVELPACPYDPRYNSLYPRLYGQYIQPPPVTYFSFMYNFYSGSLVYEFVPVKTPSHNFSIQVGFVPFNGTPGTVTEAQLQSCRWKVIDFRTSENGQFTTPWLSNRVMRNRPFSTISYASTANDFQNASNNIGWSNLNFKDPGKVVVRLVNELNPTPIVSPTIEVLVFVKAHPNLRYLSPTNFLPVSRFLNPTITSLTRESVNVENGAIALGNATIPHYTIGNFDQTTIRYEMETSKLQDGDEQTMYGDKLRDAPGPQIQTMEDHGDILELCRRFYFFGTYSGMYHRRNATDPSLPYPPYACVPLTIPSYSPLPANLIGNTTRMNSFVNPRDAILACFRWFRGSMNYVVHSLTDQPLEVTYLPAVDRPYAISSTRQEDPTFLFRTSLNTVPLFSFPLDTGLSTEIIEPRLNPILTVEVPHYNANNYVDSLSTFNGYHANENFRNRMFQNINNLTSMYLGNMVIRGINGKVSTPEQAQNDNFKVRILSAFGDDAQLHHFMGCPLISLSSVGLRWNIVDARNEIIPELDITDRVRSLDEIKSQLVAEGVESNPGPVLSKALDFLPSGLTNTFSNVAAMASDLKSLVSQPNKIVDSIEEAKIKGISMLDQIKGIIAMYSSGVDMLEITSLALTMISAFKDSTNVYTLLSALCQILRITGVFHLEAISKAMTRFSVLFSNSDSETPFTKEANHQMDNQSWSTVASIFSSIVLETFFAYRGVNQDKFSVDESYVKQVMMGTFKNFNVIRSGALYMLMTRVCRAIEFLYHNVRKWIRGLEKFDILAEDPQFVRNFMIDYEFFMDERNLSGQSLIQSHRDRFWSTVLTAYYLKSVMATVDKKYVNMTLQSAVRDIIMKANNLKSHMTAPPVRYEPYSIWYYGEPGTGKTTLMQDHLVDLAKNINCLRNGDPIYVRSPHSQWWNGYDNQPVVMIDDANGVSDPTILGRMVSEFQAMKTSAKMRLEMPRLEEKNAEMTSVILGVCSNLKEWTSSMIVDMQAFRRRRDVVVEVCYSDAAKKFFSDNPNVLKSSGALPQNLLDNNKHIVFKVLFNPSTGQENGNIMDYNAYHKFILDHHKTYHENEFKKMFHRYNKSMSLSQQLATEVMDEATLKTALMAILLGCESTEVMAETMKRQLYELKQVTPERFKALPKHTQSLLNKMSTLPVHQAPATANPQDVSHVYPGASSWFREEVLPNYVVGNFYQQIDKRYRPWNYTDVLKADTDLLTSPCSVCRNPVSPEAFLYKMCANSVEEEQHWVCGTCGPTFDRHSENCPVCREQKLVKFTNDQRHWRWYSKLQHIFATSFKDFTTPLVMTTTVLWKNARVIVVASMVVTLTLRSMQLTYEGIRELALEREAEEQVKRFIKFFGVIPNSIDRVGSTIYLNTGDRAFVQTEIDGIYSFNCIDRAFSYQMGKGKKIVKNDSQEHIDMPEINYFTPNNSEDEETTDNEQPSVSGIMKYEVKKIDVVKLIPPVKCNLEHGQKIFDFLDNKDAIYSIGYSERMLYINIKEKDQEVRNIEIPYERCEEQNCIYNSKIAIIVKKYYESRAKMWQRTVLEGESIQDLEDDAPEEIVNAFMEDEVQPVIQQPVSYYTAFINYQKELLSALKGNFISWFQYIYDVICRKWKMIISVLTLIFATYFGIKYYYSEEEGITLEPEHQIASGQHVKGRNHSKLKPATTRTIVLPKDPHHQMKISVSSRVPIQIQNCTDLIMKNRFVLTCCNTNVYAFAIMNNYGILPRHAFYYFADLQEKGQPIVFTQGETKEILKDRITMYCVLDNEIGEYVIFQYKRLTGKDLRHHFYSTPHDTVSYPPYGYGIDLKEQKPVPLQIVDAQNNNFENAQTISTTWSTIIDGKEHDFTYQSRLTDYIIVSNFYGEGKCGSPIVNPDGKIIGLHFAGQTILGVPYGYSYPVVMENFAGVGVTLGTKVNTEPEHQMESFSNLDYYAQYPNAPYHSHTSKIMPSAISQNAWDSLTYPCIQSNTDPRYKFESSPLLDGASTIGAPTISPQQDILEKAIDAVSVELISHMPTPSMEVPVSQEEAVTARNHSYVKGMNLATSAGLPLIVDNPGKNLKADYVQCKILADGSVETSFKPEFQKLYDVNWKLRLSGVPPEDPFWAHLKDERRKPEKLESFGGTRVFSVSPLELVISSRRVLLPMMEAFHSDPVSLHHAIGLSTESTDWTDMIESLRRKSDKIIQLDFSKFSDSMPWEFVSGAFEIVRRYYEKYNIFTEEVENVLKTLEHNITKSLICIGMYVYRVKNGVLQGHPLTSLINSIVNLIEQTYVWIKITGLSGNLFFKNCGIVVMGDDVVISVPKQFLKKYNGQTIANEFAKMNIVVTDENKNKDYILKYQNINRLDFLSCSYKLHPYRYLYLAPTDISSIFDTALWINRKDGPFFDATLENVEQSLNNCFGHGPCIYEMYRALLEFLTKTKFRSWFELDMIFYGPRGLPERSIIATNLGIVTGTSPKVLELLGAGTGRIERAYNKSEKDRQYWNADFLKNALLDTQGIVTGKYRCNCRYECERELDKRIKQVEQKIGVSREHFLPFTSQEEGTGILAQAVSRVADSRGDTSTIAFRGFVGVTSDSAVGEIDGMRERVQIYEDPTNIKAIHNGQVEATVLC